MPYINNENDNRLAVAAPGVPAYDAGELNFKLTRVIDQYMRAHGMSYKNINDVIGALEGAKLEFYRRVAAPYEDGKILENGDVYRCLESEQT